MVKFLFQGNNHYREQRKVSLEECQKHLEQHLLNYKMAEGIGCIEITKVSDVKGEVNLIHSNYKTRVGFDIQLNFHFSGTPSNKFLNRS